MTLKLSTRGATKTGAWYIVGMFTVLLMLSYFDRFILALLATPISEELHLTDRQMGLLLGFGFALLYSIAGVPIAYYLDRGNRVRCVAAGVLIWSAATIAAGFANSFGQLLIPRAGVAIGEAVLTPAMISLISDLFEKPDRRKPTALFLSIGAVMSGGALVAGGFAIDLAERIHGVLTEWPVWRLTLFIVGLPGVLLALALIATVKEPARRPAEATVENPESRDSTSVIAHLRAHADFYAPFYLSVGFGVSIGYAAFSWAPTILVRSYAFSLADSGYAFGMIAAPIAGGSILFWSWVSGRIGAASSGPLVTMLLGVGVALAAGVAALVWDSSTATIVAVAVMSGGSACFLVLCAFIVQHATPATMHARLVAMALLAACLIGFGLGPFALPFFAGFLGDSPMALRRAMVAYTLVVGVAVLVGLVMSLRGYKRLVRENSTREGSGDRQRFGSANNQ